MSKAFYLASPVIFLNLGTELVYILEQRLRSQEIPAAKKDKVLQDVSLTLVDSAFLKQLFAPQKPMTFSIIRDFIHHMTQISIIKLSAESLEKVICVYLALTCPAFHLDIDELQMPGLEYEVPP
jgi:hypothetical protein